MMNYYEISEGNLTPMIILAQDMDEAFAIARKVNPHYNTGQMVHLAYLDKNTVYIDRVQKK